jgi:hypothetical protein
VKLLSALLPDAFDQGLELDPGLPQQPAQITQGNRRQALGKTRELFLAHRP